MKHFTFLKSLLLLCALVVGSNVWGADTYEKATSISVGDVVVFVCEGAGTELTSISSTSTKYGIGTAFTTAPAGTYSFQVVTGSKTGTYAFKNGNDYLYWTSGNSLATNTTLSDNSSWTVGFDANGNAAIVNVNTTNRQIWWNVSSPRFACYTDKSDGDSYKYVQIYKKQTLTATTTTITSTGITNTDLKNGTAAGSLSASVTVTSTSAAVTGATVSWSSNDESVAEVSNAGVVTLKGVGTTKIKATYAGDATYASSNAEYEITVTDTRVATTTTIDASGITNTDLKNGTAAGSLSASVTVTSTSAAVGGATVTWNSDDEDVATIAADGTVTLVGVGTTTITASYAGGGDYAYSSNTYDLTVVDTRQTNPVVITAWATLFNASTTGALSGGNLKDYSGTQDNVLVEYKKGTQTNMYIKNDDLRLYKGGSLSFTAPSGYLITRIDFTGTVSADNAPIPDTGTFDRQSDIKWTGMASSVTLNRSDSNNGAAKFTSATITLSENATASITATKEWITFCCAAPLDFSSAIDGLEGAYTISSHASGETTLTATKMTGTVKAGTGLLLHAAAVDDENAQAIAIPVAASGDEQTDNMLVGVTTATTVNPTDGAGNTNLGLKNGSFVPYSTAGTLAAGKAYLQIPTADMPASGAKLTIIFDDGETTSIDLNAIDNLNTNGQMYNLAGQKVSKSYKGIVIMNGRKFINK